MCLLYLYGNYVSLLLMNIYLRGIEFASVIRCINYRRLDHARKDRAVAPFSIPPSLPNEGGWAISEHIFFSWKSGGCGDQLSKNVPSHFDRSRIYVNLRCEVQAPKYFNFWYEPYNLHVENEKLTAISYLCSFCDDVHISFASIFNLLQSNFRSTTTPPNN